MPTPTNTNVCMQLPKEEAAIAPRVEFAIFLAKIGANVKAEFMPAINGTISHRHVRIHACAPVVLSQIIEHYRFVSVIDGSVLVDTSFPRDEEEAANYSDSV